MHNRPRKTGSAKAGHEITGFRRFVSLERQRAWLDGEVDLYASGERAENLEHRFKYAARFDKLLRRPQAEDVLEILGRYGRSCIPLPRQTERDYWSVSCLPSTPEGDGWQFTLPDEGIEGTLVKLIDAGYGISGLSIERPSLHDVFVRIVGAKALAEAEALEAEARP